MEKETVVIRFDHFEYLPDGAPWEKDFKGHPIAGNYYIALKESISGKKKSINRWKICLQGETMPGIMVHSLDAMESDSVYRFFAEEISLDKAQEMLASENLNDRDFENLASILTNIRNHGNWLEEFDNLNSRVLEIEKKWIDILPDLQSLIVEVLGFGPKTEKKSEKPEEKAGLDTDYDKKFFGFEKRPYYNSHPSGIECIDVVEHMNFNCGNAVKYIWRSGLKSEDVVSDLSKAAYYINREIERIKKEKK